MVYQNVNESHTTPSPKPLTLQYDRGSVHMEVQDVISGNRELYSLIEYFHCDEQEQKIIQEYGKNGYFFIGSREYNEPYPDYMKEFLEHNPNLLSGEEKSFSRTPKVDFPEESFSELVFVKLRGVSGIDQQIQDFSFRIGELLNH